MSVFVGRFILLLMLRNRTSFSWEALNVRAGGAAVSRRPTSLPISTMGENPGPDLDAKRIAATRVWLARGLYFLGYATVGASVPFITVYLGSLGLPSSQLGIIGAITPVMTTASSPVWGAIADKTKKHEEIMLSNHLLSVATRTLLLLLATSTALKAKSYVFVPLIIGVAAALMAPVYSIMDDVCFRAAKAEGGSGGWARLRLFGSLGYGFGAYITGQLADKSSLSYGVAFLVSAAISIPCAAIMSLLLATRPAPALNVEENSTKKATNIENIALTQAGNPVYAVLKQIRSQSPISHVLWISILLCGASYGFLEIFLFPTLKSLGSASNILGKVRSVNAFSALPFYFFSNLIIKKFGVACMMSAATLAYAIRLLFHASCAARGTIPVPLALFSIECLYGLTGGGMWSAAASFAQASAPPGLGATTMGLLSALHFGVGMSLGSYFGGSVTHKYGNVVAFRSLAALDLFVTSICLFMIARKVTGLSKTHKKYSVNVDAVDDQLLLGDYILALKSAWGNKMHSRTNSKQK